MGSWWLKADELYRRFSVGLEISWAWFLVSTNIELHFTEEEAVACR